MSIPAVCQLTHGGRGEPSTLQAHRFQLRHPQWRRSPKELRRSLRRHPRCSPSCACLRSRLDDRLHPKGQNGLTLNGSTEWPNGKDLFEFAEGRSPASPRQLRAILQQTCDALSDTASLAETSMKSTLKSNWLEAVSSEWKKGIEAIGPLTRTT